MELRKEESEKAKTCKSKTKNTETHPPKSSKCYYWSISPKTQKLIGECKSRMDMDRIGKELTSLRKNLWCLI